MFTGVNNSLEIAVYRPVGHSAFFFILTHQFCHSIRILGSQMLYEQATNILKYFVFVQFIYIKYYIY